MVEFVDLEFGAHGFLINHVFLPTEQAETNICWIIYQDASFKICLSLFGWKENIVPKMHIVHCTYNLVADLLRPFLQPRWRNQMETANLRWDSFRLRQVLVVYLHLYWFLPSRMTRDIPFLSKWVLSIWDVLHGQALKSQWLSHYHHCHIWSFEKVFHESLDQYMAPEPGVPNVLRIFTVLHYVPSPHTPIWSPHSSLGANSCGWYCCLANGPSNLYPSSQDHTNHPIWWMLLVQPTGYKTKRSYKAGT